VASNSLAQLEPQGHPAPPAKIGRFYDYSAMLPFCSGQDNRYPTDEELEQLSKVWPDVPPEENAAFHLVRAAALLKQRGEPPGSVSSADPYAGDKKALEEWVEANRPGLDGMEKALSLRKFKLPYFYQTPYYPKEWRGPREPVLAVPLLGLTLLRHLGRTCRDAALVAELNGRHEEAMEWHLRCIRMGTMMRQDGCMIQDLVGIAVSCIGLDGLHRLMANRPLPEDSLRRVIAECRAARTQPNEAATVWDNECVYQSLEYARYGGRWREFWELLTFKAEAKTILVPPREAFLKALPDMQGRLRRILSRPIPDLVSAQPGFRNLWGTQAKDDEVTAAYYQVQAPILEPWLCEMARLDVYVRAAEVRAAILLHEKKHGKPPVRLEDLVPDYLPALPQDPFAKAPLRYELRKYGWILWSVGEDHKDDGAHSFSLTNSWDGHDYTFTSVKEANEQRGAFCYELDKEGNLRLVEVPRLPEVEAPGVPRATLK
jgi:hypothetical protein